MHRGTLDNGGERWRGREELLSKVVIFVFLCHTDYFNDVLTTFLGLGTFQLHFCLCRVKNIYKIYKYLNLCSKDELKVLRVWNDMRVLFVSLHIQVETQYLHLIVIQHCLGKKSYHHQHAINLGLVLAAKDLFVVSFVAWETMAAFEGNWTADFGVFDLGMQPSKHAASQLWHSLQLTVALTSACFYRYSQL